MGVLSKSRDCDPALNRSGVSDVRSGSATSALGQRPPLRVTDVADIIAEVIGDLDDFAALDPSSESSRKDSQASLTDGTSSICWPKTWSSTT